MLRRPQLLPVTLATVALATVALAAAAPCEPAAAADDDRDALVEAVEQVLHGSDAATRERGRETLRSEPEAAVRLLLQALEELAAARRPPTAVSTLVEAPAHVPPRAAAADEPVVRIYDVRDLIDRLGSAEQLAERLRRHVAEGDSVTPHDSGTLVVRTSPLRQSDVELALNAARRDVSEIVHVETRVLSAPLDAPLGRDVSGARPGSVVPLEDPVGTVAEWLRAGDAEVLTSPALSCFPGQRVSVDAGREISFVADFDVEVAQSAFIADPIVETVFAGIRVELVPTLQGDGLRIAVRAAASAVELETFTSTLHHETVELQIPAVTRSEVRRTVELRDGGTIVLRLADDATARRLLVLTATRESLEDD